LPLSSFTPPVREWFERAFEAPTPAQAQAWPAIATGEHVLISAPTGSGKTLAAFLWALDKLSREPAAHTRLVYVSPLKALAYDVDRNLRAPLRGSAPTCRWASAPATRRSATARRCAATRPTS
jgi:ATP-dependent Lhr-like helicase